MVIDVIYDKCNETCDMTLRTTKVLANQDYISQISYFGENYKYPMTNCGIVTPFGVREKNHSLRVGHPIVCPIPA